MESVERAKKDNEAKKKVNNIKERHKLSPTAILKLSDKGIDVAKLRMKKAFAPFLAH